MIDTSYRDTLNQVLHSGHTVESRYGPTKELILYTWNTWPGQYPLRPGLNPAIGYMELCQLIAGVYDPDAIARVAPNADLSLFTAEMAYGPRLKDQIDNIIHALATNPDTRQAVMFVGSKYDGPTSNLPCTETIQYLIRGGRLYCVVNMRSWDLIKGLPYDVIMFGGLQLLIAHILNIPVGHLNVVAASAHIYMSDVERGRVPQTEMGIAQFTIDPAFQYTEWERTARNIQDFVAAGVFWYGGIPRFLQEVPRDDNS